MFRKLLWYFPYYRLKIFKISLKKIDKNNLPKNLCLIYINNLTNVKSIPLPSYISEKIIYLDRKKFDEWFKNYKNKKIKYLFVSNKSHCLYEYRIIRSNGYKAYMLTK